jgi:hypothetical protein
MKVKQYDNNDWLVMDDGGNVIARGLKDEVVALSVASFLEDEARGEIVPRSE